MSTTSAMWICSRLGSDGSTHEKFEPVRAPDHATAECAAWSC